MEEMFKTAQSYYNCSSPEMKQSANEFFKSLDFDGDGKVSRHELSAFMRKKGYPKMSNPYFFNELDKDGNNTLDFMEVMALYYIIKSGRPFCEGCGYFIPGMFWTCSSCFEHGGESFCLCSACFDSRCYIHEHNNFIDNYALLENKRKEAVDRRTAAAQAQVIIPSSSVTITELPAFTSTSTAVVPYSAQADPWMIRFGVIDAAFKALELSLNVASGWCSIM